MPKTIVPLIAALAVTLPSTASAQAEVSTDVPGAILVFPHVVSDGDNDTVVQVTNNTGSRIHLRCFYIDGRTNREDPNPTWFVTDFQATLTRLQPMIWVVGQGLPAVPPDRPDDLYPGPIPPVSDGFHGSLRCMMVDDSERPIGVNALTGEATIVDRTSGASRKYSATSVRGFPDNDGDNTLLLDGEEYATCPRVLLLNHLFDDAPDPVTDSPIRSRVTFVPCSMDLEASNPGSATLQFEVFNEFEQRLSTSLGVSCYEQIELSNIDGASSPSLSIFNFALQGTVAGLTRIRPVNDSGTNTGRGVIAIAEERRTDFDSVADVHVHYIGGNLQADVMVLPDPF